MSKYFKFLGLSYIAGVLGTFTFLAISNPTKEVFRLLPAIAIVPLTYGIGYTIFGSIAGFLYLRKELK